MSGRSARAGSGCPMPGFGSGRSVSLDAGREVGPTVAPAPLLVRPPEVALLQHVSPLGSCPRGSSPCNPRTGSKHPGRQSVTSRSPTRPATRRDCRSRPADIPSSAKHAVAKHPAARGRRRAQTRSQLVRTRRRPHGRDRGTLALREAADVRHGLRGQLREVIPGGPC
jgi:hypothetical protein